MNRPSLNELAAVHFDLIVIGAGINGAAIARDAAMRGLRVVLLDKNDISSGTTSWSTRLIHGGLRYLEYFEFGLVRESLRERERLLHNAPHLVQPLAMILPIFAGAKRGKLLIRTGMSLYDVLSFDKSLDHHRLLSTRETLARVGSLERDGLKGSAVYFDAQATFAERLAVENVLSARQHGAAVRTYTEAGRLVTEGAVVRGVEVTDRLTGETAILRGRWVVNVAGPWVDEVLTGAPAGKITRRYIGGTKGSHLVVRPFPGAPQDALYYEAKRDGRVVMVVPWNGFYLIGSTDLRYTGDLDDVEVSDEEIDYLLSETNGVLPGAGLTPANILYSYAGVRPLPATTSGNEGAITRRHVIENHAPQLRGLLSIIGGKLTTHRSLAEEVVDKICDELAIESHCVTATTPLPGAAGIAIAPFTRELTAESPLPAATVSRLVSIYGSRATEIVALAAAEPRLAEPFDSETGAIGAEIVFAVEREMAETLADILLRRTMVGLASHAGVGPDLTAATVARDHLGWSPERAAREVAEYRRYVERFRPRSLRTISQQ